MRFFFKGKISPQKQRTRIFDQNEMSLFAVNNAFHLGAYQIAINEASEIEEQLSQQEMIERDCIVYRAYIALGSYQVRNEGRFWHSELFSSFPFTVLLFFGVVRD